MYLDVDITAKKNIVLGLMVDIIEDKNKSSQEITRGYVKRLISNSDCKKGIRVELTNGAIGHIQGIPSKNEIKKDKFKFYNIFFYQEYIYSIWSKKEKKFFIMNRKNNLTNKIERTLILFSSKELLEQKIKNTIFENTKEYCIRGIRRKNKDIITFFQDYEFDVVSIDFERKLTKEQLIKLEKKFKSF